MKLPAGLIGALLALGACTTAGSTATSDDPSTTASSISTSESVTTETTVPTTTTDQSGALPETTEPPPELRVGAVLTGEGTLEATVVKILPHDFGAQTQGLAWAGDSLVESTGAYGSSERRFLGPVSAQTSQEKFLVPELFATDIAIAGDVGIQLSGREGIATTFDSTNLNEIGQIRYEGEGWGLCLDGDTLVMSDNSETLVRRNSETLAIVSPQPSPDDLNNLRALECAKEWIWAIVGDTNMIAVINTASGELDGSIDVTELLPATAGPDDAASALAFSPETETFFVAGRRWGVFYEISVEFPSG